MSHKYTIRIWEDFNQRGSTTPGTIVLPVRRELSFYAESGEEAEQRVRNDVAAGNIPAGRVYQICPSMAEAGLIRTIAASLDGSCQRVFLDPAEGLYGESRRIRLPRPRVPDADESVTRLQDALKR
jgi:hypothetical protein